MAIRRATATVLSLIRIFNGAPGLVAPEEMAKQLGSAMDDDKTFVYPARMFDIRTLVLGFNLLLVRGGPRRSALLKQAVLIHGVDTLAAFWWSVEPAVSSGVAGAGGPHYPQWRLVGDAP
ncbi:MULTISPECIES: hypothetical protein [unclassified Amycolatopsis]|uniref:hypothetical protein n=1 Tax=unclassified Amycolatopsis TaxID=2618356 RepID=UPI001C69F84A|nr:hypothetical protein [Amycolatopsis sp. DSM 110486]QYN23590.1 hypothetical protein K1T34_14745 [Amycolatopsis sp. DSM 110486]